MRKTKEEAGETRAAILEAALALFSERGVSETTLADVAQKAGVTRGAIYWHFENKKTLFQALRDEAVQPYAQIVSAGERTDEPDPLGKLKSALRAIFTDLSNDTVTRQVFQIWLTQTCSQRGIDSARHEGKSEESLRRQETFKRIELILRNAIRHGQLEANFDARLGAFFMLSFIDGMVISMLVEPQPKHAQADILRALDAVFFMLQNAAHHYLSAI